MKRYEGYYWIRIKQSEIWQIAEYDGEAWWICGSELWFNKDDIAEIGEKIVRK